MDDILKNFESDFAKSLDNLKQELSTLRVGRANPALIENIPVDAYGSISPLRQVASISVTDARTMVIAPWDKSISKDIEKAIIAANIGINPVNEGQQLRLSVPQLTEESRKQLTKSVGEKMEKTRITIRQIRDKAKDEINKAEKNKEISEDAKFDSQKKLDEKVKQLNEQVKQIGEAKEKEIMTI